ncbi:MAG: hypothetical protein JXA49_04560 [Actinobacteria bacterium]|nr:hypothetical protein [Actinomycetota bacterium]
MDRKHDNGKEIDITEPEELVVIVKKIKSIPKIKPSRLLKLKVSFYSLFPGFALFGDTGTFKSGKAGMPAGKSTDRYRSPAFRYSTAAASVLIAVLLVFSGLTVAARNSNPGDALYSLKRARESLELAFTFDRSMEMEKTLIFAEKRLAELDFMLENDRLDPDGITAVIDDYKSKTALVAHAIQTGELDGAGNLKSRFNALVTAENNIEKRLVAAGPAGTMKPAGNAHVTVKDVEGGLSFKDGGDSISGSTDSRGIYSFNAVVTNPGEINDMEVVVEAEGRTAVVPAFSPVHSVKCGPFEAEVYPPPGTLELNQSDSFSLTVLNEGRAASGTTVRLCDSTGTSSIEGRGAAASLITDENGTVSFEITKTSVEQVSRISLDILDNGWNPLGEILAVGGVNTGGADSKASGKVEARATKSPAGYENIVLDNGLVRVSVNGGSGDIITAITRNGETAGPVTDPGVQSGSATADNGRKLEGPVLTFTGPDSAVYEVSHEINSENRTLTKIYSVSLKKDQPYATIDCTIQADGTGWKSEPALDLYRLEFRNGSRVSISGKETKQPGDEKAAVVSFNPGKPYAAAESAGGLSFIACPAGFAEYPDSWVLGRGYLDMRLESSRFQNGSIVKVSALVTAADPKDARKLELESMKTGGVAPGMDPVAGVSRTGFAVRTRPECEELRKGEQRFTITVFKEYEKLFD